MCWFYPNASEWEVNLNVIKADFVIFMGNLGSLQELLTANAKSSWTFVLPYLWVHSHNLWRIVYCQCIIVKVFFSVFLVTGAALHIHSSALVSVEWLVKNVTYRPHCYICFTWDNSVRFRFSERQPLLRWDCFYWQHLETLRAQIGDPTEFDNRLGEQNRPSADLARGIETGGIFQSDAAPDAGHRGPRRRVHQPGGGLAEVWESLHGGGGPDQPRPRAERLPLQGSERAPARQHLVPGTAQRPFRGSRSSPIWRSRSGAAPSNAYCLFQTYELDGTIHEKVWSLKIFQEVTKRFMADHPDFLGARIIISAHRYCLEGWVFSQTFADESGVSCLHQGSGETAGVTKAMNGM